MNTSPMKAFLDERTRRVAINGIVSIFVDWPDWHFTSMTRNPMSIGPSVRLRSLCAQNDDVGVNFLMTDANRPTARILRGSNCA